MILHHWEIGQKRYLGGYYPTGCSEKGNAVIVALLIPRVLREVMALLLPQWLSGSVCLILTVLSCVSCVHLHVQVVWYVCGSSTMSFEILYKKHYSNGISLKGSFTFISMPWGHWESILAEADVVAFIYLFIYLFFCFSRLCSFWWCSTFQLRRFQSSIPDMGVTK